MSASAYSRPLSSPDLIRNFLEIALGYQYADKNELNNVCKKITVGELELVQISPQYDNTLVSKKYRHFNYLEDDVRWKLRTQIVNELFSKKRINNDEKIKLGTGGSKPTTSVKNESEAYIIIGLPASGKSSISNHISDLMGAYILDSDYAKRKLPEFREYRSGASLVHLESDALIFPQAIANKPQNFSSLFERCIQKKCNLCIPKIGYDPDSIKGLAIALNKVGYKVHLILVSLDRRKATIRAIKRYITTNRYVPIGLIFDGYANDPILTYYRLKNSNQYDKIFESFGAISTDVNEGDKPLIVDIEGNSPIQIFK